MPREFAESAAAKIMCSADFPPHAMPYALISFFFFSISPPSSTLVCEFYLFFPFRQPSFFFFTRAVTIASHEVFIRAMFTSTLFSAMLRAQMFNGMRRGKSARAPAANITPC